MAYVTSALAGRSERWCTPSQYGGAASSLISLTPLASRARQASRAACPLPDASRSVQQKIAALVLLQCPTTTTCGGIILWFGEATLNKAALKYTWTTFAMWTPCAGRQRQRRSIGWRRGAQPSATEATRMVAASGGKSFVMSGEPPRNRTENPQIKSLL